MSIFVLVHVRAGHDKGTTRASRGSFWINFLKPEICLSCASAGTVLISVEKPDVTLWTSTRARKKFAIRDETQTGTWLEVSLEFVPMRRFSDFLFCDKAGPRLHLSAL